jgi:hypothetical protein
MGWWSPVVPGKNYKLMKHLCLALLALAFLVSQDIWAFDFTPRLLERQGGYPTKYVPYFISNGLRYTAYLSDDVSLTGDRSLASFFFKKLDGATCRVMNSPLTPKEPFQDPNLTVYRQTAIRYLPADAKKAKIISEAVLPDSLTPLSVFCFVFSYELAGQKLVQEVAFMNFSPTEQFLAIITATEKQFPEVQTRSRGILLSFRKTDPKEDLTAEVFD